MKVKSVSTLKTPRGRWIIILPAARDWAWSGARWVNHHHGVSLEAQVMDFETEQQALDYAVEHLIVRQELCNRRHRKGPEIWSCVRLKNHQGDCSPFVEEA